MHEVLTGAVNKAIRLVQESVADASDPAAELRKKYKGMSKTDLIEELVNLQAPKRTPVKVEDIAYKILEDPDCAWLTWEVIAAVMNKHLPNCKTTVKSLQWYGSKGLERGRNVVTRKKPAEALALLVAS